jgi:RNA polymerase sigma factor (TIGR02999 family)
MSEQTECNQAADLLPQLYGELRKMAAAHLKGERKGHTLQPTALVHEAYLNLSRWSGHAFRGRTHFLAAASVVMRRVLVDHARARKTAKRGGGWRHVTVDETVALRDDRVEDVLAVNQALDALAAIDPRAARIVEMRFFAGMTAGEVGEAIGMSERWVREQWTFARAWLRRALDSGA